MTYVSLTVSCLICKLLVLNREAGQCQAIQAPKIAIPMIEDSSNPGCSLELGASVLYSKICACVVASSLSGHSSLC